jgi:hypothetical protein
MTKGNAPGHPRLKALDLGPLPATHINRALGLSLVPAKVHFSVRAQLHALQRHPDNFTICMRHIASIVAKPDYAGQSPGQSDGFELIGEAHQDQALVLVAINISRDQAGRYIVASTYLIDRNKLERRVRKRFLKPL